MPSAQIIQGRSRIKWFLGLQGVIVAVLAFVLGVFVSLAAAMSALLGGLVCILPTAFFARQVFRHSGAQAAKQIVQAMYLGEALKILISVVLFTLIFIYVDIVPLPFFGAFILAQLVVWLAPLVLKTYR